MANPGSQASPNQRRPRSAPAPGPWRYRAERGWGPPLGSGGLGPRPQDLKRARPWSPDGARAKRSSAQPGQWDLFKPPWLGRGRGWGLLAGDCWEGMPAGLGQHRDINRPGHRPIEPQPDRRDRDGQRSESHPRGGGRSQRREIRGGPWANGAPSNGSGGRQQRSPGRGVRHW